MIFSGSTSLAKDYFYQSNSGTCENFTGEQGLNLVMIDDLHDNGDGECADFRGVILDEEEKSNLWTSWDLRGADLTGSELFFSYIKDAKLMGANLSGLNYGYAHVHGFIDQFTQIPLLGKCVVDGSKIECVR